MLPPTSFIDRFLASTLDKTLARFPVVLLQGPRQCGKTTLARMVEDRRGYEYHTFDEEETLALAKKDPWDFVAGLPERAILDEVQRMPEIFRTIKLSVDMNRRPGRFILTGSTNPFLNPQLGDSLAGRIAVLRLHPLAQSELAGQAPTFLDALFGEGFCNLAPAPLPGPQQEDLFRDRLHSGPRREGLPGTSPHDRTGKPQGIDLVNRIVAGGYPAALAGGAEEEKTQWYRHHATMQLARDAKDIARIRSPEMLSKLLGVVSSRTGNLLNVNKLTEPLESTRPTINGYVSLLERMFLLDKLPSWHMDHRARLVRKPKLHVGDTGIACALLGIDGERLHHNREILGPMLETFVMQELAKQASWHSEPLQLSYFRDRDGREVDIVIESGSLGPLVGIEVKATKRVARRDLLGLEALADLSGDRFVRGIVLHDGPASKRFNDRFEAVPVRRLWENP